MKKIVIFGAASAIAHEVAKHFAETKAEFYLIGKTPEKLEAVKQDLLSRGATSVTAKAADLRTVNWNAGLVETIKKQWNEIDLVLLAHGEMGNQKASETVWEAADSVLLSNYVSYVSLLNPLGKWFEEQKKGSIAVISSVAGDRGRMSNYIYGSTKAGVSAFVEGFSNHMSHYGVHVLLVKPGLVKTPMTAHMKHSFLSANVQTVGLDIYNAILKKKTMIYTPWYWFGIMKIVRAIPTVIFNRLKL